MDGGPSKDYLKSIRACPGEVPKKDRVWLASCLALAATDEQLLVQASSEGGRGKRPTNAARQTTNRALLRRRVKQGAPYKCPVLREFLYDWFVDMRASVCSNITPRFALMKATALADTVLAEQRKVGNYVALPKLDKHWLLRWKRDKGVGLRRPTLRFKCSRSVMIVRLRAMWTNLIRVRRLTEVLFGNDMASAIYGIDEKPLHFNESGSKNTCSLELVGAPSVKLKQNHAATRERATVMTTVSSNVAAAGQPRRLPVEVLFRAKSSRRTRHLLVPADLNFSVAWTEKGSYRLENILCFLERWLDPWTPERALANDYRVLMLDVAGCHLPEEVLTFCETRGYLAMYHYGCTTGVAQVNDTDLHGIFERRYLEIEQAAFVEQQLLSPGSVSRTPQQVLDDIAFTWRVLDHVAVGFGHLRTGLSNKLNGSEDDRISREAREFWVAADMDAERQRALAEVDAFVAAGKGIAEWRQLVRDPPDPGHMTEEGQELEMPLGPDESAALTEADELLLVEDDADIEGMHDGPELEAVVPVEAPGDQSADVSEAAVLAARLEKLRSLRREALAHKLPGAVFQCNRELNQLERGYRSKGKAELEQNLVWRRALREASAKEAASRKRRREEHQKRLEEARKEKAAKVAAAAKVAKALAEKKALQARIAALPKTFSAADCGAAGDAGVKARAACLERLAVGSPKLSFENRVRWPEVRDFYAKHAAKVLKVKSDAVGVPVVKSIDKVLEALKEHYTGKSDYKALAGGDVNAFSDFFAGVGSGETHASAGCGRDFVGPVKQGASVFGPHETCNTNSFERTPRPCLSYPLLGFSQLYFFSRPRGCRS